MTDRIQYASNGPITLAYETFGEATHPPLVLIMGLGAQMLVWPEAFCRRLAERGYYVVRFDNRDVGLSSKVEAPAGCLWRGLLRRCAGRPATPVYELDAMAGDTLALMDHLGLASAHIVGASMGGMIAQVMAADHPDRVRSLTALMSSAGTPRLGRPSIRFLARLLASCWTSPGSDPLEGKVRALGLIGSRSFPTDPAIVRQRVARARARSSDDSGAGRQLLAILASGDRSDRLRRIRAPALVLHGDEDPLIPEAVGRDLAQRIPGARFERLSGMGHDFPVPLLSRLERLVAAHLVAAEVPERALPVPASAIG